MREPINMRTIVLRVSALSLLLLLVLVATLTVRTLNRVPNTLLYFVQAHDTTFSLRGVARNLPQAKGDAHLKESLQALIDGPSESEAAQGLRTALEPDTQILNLRLLGSEVEVDLSNDFTEGGGSATMQGRLNQVFYTLTQPTSVSSVRLLVEGVPVSYLGGEGILVDNPWNRAEHETLPTW